MTYATDTTKAGAEPASTAGWGWLVALGALLLIAGLVASVSLFAATLVSIIYIGALMIVGGIMQLVFAFAAPGWRKKTLWVIGGLFYAVAGVLVFANPLLAAAGISLAIGAVLIVAGAMRIVSGFREHAREQMALIVAAGVVTVLAGIFVLAAWPSVSLWLLGAVLAVDLIFQGLTTISTGLSLRKA